MNTDGVFTRVVSSREKLGLSDAVSRASRAHWTGVFLVAATGIAALWSLSVLQDIYAFRSGAWSAEGRIWLLDVDVEESIFTWVSVLLFFSAAQSIVRFSSELPDARSSDRLFWYAMAGIFALMSLEELIGLHEKFTFAMQERYDLKGVFLFAWAIPAGILALLGLLATMPFLAKIPDRIRNLMLLSAAVFLMGAVGLEIVGSVIVSDQSIHSVGYRIETNLEEAFEAAGLLIFIYACLSYRDILASRSKLTR